MRIVSISLALLSGIVGAGFASGREIARFFSGHGAACAAAVVSAGAALLFFFLRLCAKMDRFGADGAAALCRARFGARLGAVCTGLFVLLCAVTAGAMLAACAELSALTLPMRHAYGAGMAFSLALGLFLARREGGLAFSGAALLLVLPVLLVRLLHLPAGEACFYPAMAPDLPVRAAADGLSYAALNAAMLLGVSPMLLPLENRQRTKAVFLFCLLFCALLILGSAVCSRHLPVAMSHPMPFVALSRRLGGGYLLVALCLYAAALSTLSAMLLGVARMLPLSRGRALLLSGAAALLFARAGFGSLVQSAYPVLGAVCAALLLLLCA